VIATAVGLVCLIAGGVLGFAIGHKIATLDALFDKGFDQ
jgi:hypothetical protein